MIRRTEQPHGRSCGFILSIWRNEIVHEVFKNITHKEVAMASYTNEYSKFPEQLMALHQFMDVTDNIAAFVDQIKLLQSRGSYRQAARLIELNKDILGKYFLSAEYLNFLDEETRNLEIMAKSKNQSIYYQDPDPIECCLTNDVWIGV